MQLHLLLNNIADISWPIEQGGRDILAISNDSREDQQGALFFALGGFKFRGIDFLPEVIAKGAVAVVISQEEATVLSKELAANTIVITAKDPKALLRIVALRFYDTPAKHVATIGITGTNGKTTFTYVMESIIHAAGKECGVVGTVNYRVGNEILPAKNTTPGFLEIQRLLNDLRRRKATYCVMEVSSHALDQGRVDGVSFAAAVFSNLTQDHLDYHKTMEGYFRAKSLLFTNLAKGIPAIINTDDPYGKRLTQMTKGKPVTYAITAEANVKATGIHYSLDGTRFKIVFPTVTIDVVTALIGKHNVYNLLAAATCAYALGISPTAINAGIGKLSNIPGRLEAVTTDKGFYVFVDYAHTDDGLLNVLTALREVSASRIITVFGCGGDRDKTKRPKMGAVVGAHADHAVVTSDNPRSEDPLAIINDILPGFTKKNFEVCPDRREAIARALHLAKPGDIVLLAGKGHEDYQILANKTIAFDERAIVKELLHV